ncbi:MAG: hypothetical protein LKE39_00135 [Sphaerochaeta sp.]|jgi:transcriptional regulator with XRE-family HTH domain|nr:hypothetical protein [Sphaerochaeta sp.]
MKEEEAKAFWQRFDEQRKKSGLSIKEITDKLDLSYPLLITQRSRGIFPSITTACKIAKLIRTSVEYLATGEEPGVGAGGPVKPGEERMLPLDIVIALARSSDDDLKLVRRIYGL